ncbi:acyl-CoA thioesterase II [Blastococcus sp. TF02A-26]|uniref:acyl-CoA thioesterase n=1 Tax=Blastococcus sp. TF02A-26 TaxID=2250577 RepID=UPI000DEA2185|nr:acyl-CoA thioesterase domain-containing protein [Blastococcus sp. TF02A-26]RBY90641.1 acyl-CoA thioesterase II [Blastococcus sp. TF02A-26]
MTGIEELLRLERTGETTFRAAGHGRTGADRAFGGAAIAQSLMAAARTVDPDRVVHSLHAYFLRGAEATAPTTFRVEPIRDGGSYTTRSVTTEQGHGVVLRLTASFSVPEDGMEHQVAELDAPSPEDSPGTAEAGAAADGAVRNWFETVSRRHPFEIRFASELPRLAAGRGESAPPRQRLWLRARDPLPDDDLVHACALAYASDILMLSTTLAPHATMIGAPGVSAASLDHAVWFHGPVRADRWFFYDQESPWAAGGRGLGQGRLFDRAGRLVATVVQEGMIRRRPVRS